MFFADEVCIWVYEEEFQVRQLLMAMKSIVSVSCVAGIDW